MRTRRLPLFAIALSTTLGAAALGCGGTASSEQPTTASAAATRAPVAQSAHGPVKMVGDALTDVPLTAAQRADIEQLASGADARHSSARAARKSLMTALAAQVEAGAIDRAALRPNIDAVAAAVAALQPADRAAFERLRAILGPDQRTAFVDALEARMHERMAESMGEAHKGGMIHWAQQLKLSDDQREQIKAAAQRLRSSAHEEGGGPAWKQQKERGAKVLEAFKKDRFILDEVAPARDVGRLAVKSTE
ncbi:MAG: Spy/CpxP family protein refolding chaperone, partial [Myxococcota bacterium]|nr:Spy/CpxP family protein refolding chaperone [Myxococcota bacterium]